MGDPSVSGQVGSTVELLATPSITRITQTRGQGAPASCSCVMVPVAPPGPRLALGPSFLLGCVLMEQQEEGRSCHLTVGRSAVRLDQTQSRPHDQTHSVIVRQCQFINMVHQNNKSLTSQFSQMSTTKKQQCSKIQNTETQHKTISSKRSSNFARIKSWVLFNSLDGLSGPNTER